MSPYGVTRPQYVDPLILELEYSNIMADDDDTLDLCLTNSSAATVLTV